MQAESLHFAFSFATCRSGSYSLAAPATATDYLDTGHWSKKAIEEAHRYCSGARRR